MAEQDNDVEVEMKEEETTVKTKVKEEQKYKEAEHKNPKCNIRIEELAKPKKMHVENIYKSYKRILPDRNIRAIIAFLREELAKSPEDTEIDFKKLEKKFIVKKCRKICKKNAKRQHCQKIYESKRRNMLNILTEILKKFMARAYFNPKQIIMTTRLRRVSNKILKEICKISGVSVPKRDSTTIRATLMFAVADYFAYCIDQIYYELQVQKITEYEEITQKEIEATPTKTEVDSENTKRTSIVDTKKDIKLK